MVSQMTKTAAMHKNNQNSKRSSSELRGYGANCLETWYVASGTVVLQNLYKTSSWVDLDLIYSKVNFGSIGIWTGKAETTYFLLL